MKIWQAEDREDPTDAAPGTILAAGGDGIDVSCRRQRAEGDTDTDAR